MKNKRFNDKTVYKIVALALTIVLWFYVAQANNSIEEKMFEVPIDYVNLASDLAISDRETTVGVRVSAQANVLENISTQDIVATVDLANANTGQNILPVKVSLPSQVQLVSVNPIDIAISIEDKIETQVIVEPDVTATAQDGYTLLEPVLFPNEVVISGAANVINSISRVYVNVDGTDLNTTYSAALPIIVEDAAGNNLTDQVSLSTENIDVMLPVIDDLPSKVMPISADLVGEPAEGYAVSRIIISPNIVTAYGSQIALDKDDYVYTESIDIEGATSNVAAKVNLISTDDIRLDVTDSVDVYVQIERQTTRTFDNVPVNLLNTGNYQYELSSKYVSVTVTGAESVLENLSQNSISVECDVAGLTSGSTQVRLNATVTGSAYMTAISPQTVTVTTTSN